jgi:hypothetical protein
MNTTICRSGYIYPDMEDAWDLYKSFAAKGLVEHTLGDEKIRKRED